MQAALEIAAYVLGFTLLLGVVLVGLLMKDLFFGRGFAVPHPAPQRLPTEALHEARDVVRRLKAVFEDTDTAGRQRLDLHARRMRERLEHLEQKTIDDQSAYYRAVGLQERAWRHWKAVHNQVSGMARADRPRAQHHLQDAERHFRQFARQVTDEWEKGIVRDRLNVEELRGLGLLDPDYGAALLRRAEPEPEPAPWDTLPAGPAEPRPAAPSLLSGQAAGMLTYRSLRELVRGAVVNWRKATGRAVDLARDIAGAPGEPPLAQDAAAASATEAWHQADLLDVQYPKAGRPYGDETFSVAGLPLGTLVQADLSACTFTAVKFTGVHRHVDGRFIGADLRGIVLARQERPHQFVRCNLAQADLSGARVTFVLFYRCNLAGTRWFGAALDRVKFTECTLDGVDWGGCDLSRTVFTEEAQSADFSTAVQPPLFAPPSGEGPPSEDSGPPAESAGAQTVDAAAAAGGPSATGEEPLGSPPPLTKPPATPPGTPRNG